MLHAGVMRQDENEKVTGIGSVLFKFSTSPSSDNVLDQGRAERGLGQVEGEIGILGNTSNQLKCGLCHLRAGGVGQDVV